MRRLRELRQRSAAVASIPVEPEVFAEDFLVPVGALCGDDDGAAVGRNLHAVEGDGIEEFIQGDQRLLLSENGAAESEEDKKPAKGSHRKRKIYTRHAPNCKSVT